MPAISSRLPRGTGGRPAWMGGKLKLLSLFSTHSAMVSVSLILTFTITPLPSARESATRNWWDGSLQAVSAPVLQEVVEVVGGGGLPKAVGLLVVLLLQCLKKPAGLAFLREVFQLRIEIAGKHQRQCDAGDESALAAISAQINRLDVLKHSIPLCLAGLPGSFSPNPGAEYIITDLTVKNGARMEGARDAGSFGSPLLGPRRVALFLLIVLLSCGLAGWLFLFLWHALQTRGAVKLSGTMDFPLQSRPLVSILIPARNEAEILTATLPRFLAQDYGNFEVILVDDASTDATAGVAARLASSCPERFRLLRVDTLPPGWIGKPHALDVAFRAAQGEWVLAADAGCPAASQGATSRLVGGGTARSGPGQHLCFYGMCFLLGKGGLAGFQPAARHLFPLA